MKWHTEINLHGMAMPTVNHAKHVMMVGSCFTDEVGSRLAERLFDVDINPFGTLFNPASITDAIIDTVECRRFKSSDFFESEGRFLTLSRHSSFSFSSPDEAVASLNRSVAAARKSLERADLLIITLGSAIGFLDKESNCIVANCHKLPASRFERVELSVSETVKELRALIKTVRRLNPKIDVILTVSPVRHVGYGLVADRLSKSRLIVAAHEVCNSSTHYFPSYEMVIDDLRDYRFCADDLVHPSAQAVDYVFDGFAQSTMTPTTVDIASGALKAVKLARHRCYDAKSKEANLARAAEMVGNLSTQSGIPELIVRFNNLIANDI